MARDYIKMVESLLAQAEDPTVTKAESEAFLAKALEVMAREGIDRAIIEAGKPVPDVMIDLIKQFDAPYAVSKADLFAAIAVSFRCKVLKMPGNDKRYHVFGYRSDVDNAEFLYTTLLLHGGRMLTRTRIPAGVQMKSFTTSWWMGYSSEISRRLREANKVVVDSTPESAVVLFDREKAADAAMHAIYKKTHKLTRYYGSSAGYSSGKEEGSKVSLTPTTRVNTTNRRAIS